MIPGQVLHIPIEYLSSKLKIATVNKEDNYEEIRYEKLC